MRQSPDQEGFRTAGELLEEKAEQLGKKPFVHFKDETYSYSDIDRKSSAVADRLRERGIGQGDIIGVYLYNRPEYLFTIFAAAKLGAMFAPIDTRRTGEFLERALTETKSEVIIVDEDTRKEYEKIRDEVPTNIIEIFAGPQDVPSTYEPYSNFLDGNPDSHRGVEVNGSDTFSVNYAQRLTPDQPNGIRLPHYSYVNTGRTVAQQVLDLSGNDCIFTTQPLFGNYAIQVGLFGALVAEAEFAFEKRFDQSQYWQWTRDHQASVMLYVGRTLSVLLNEQSGGTENPLEYAFGNGFGYDSGTEVLTAFEENFDITVLEMYGTTLTGSLAAANRPHDRKLGTAGRPLDGITVEIVDDNDWIVPEGVHGEILVRSDQPNTMAHGIYGNASLSNRINRNRWIHTGDLGYKDEDGYVVFTSNKAHSIRLGRIGSPISSLEIESVIKSHPAVADSAVVEVVTENGKSDIKAVVVPERESNVGPLDIITHSEQQLSHQKLPRYIEFRDELPRKPTGKIEKKELQDENALTDIWDRERGYEWSR